MVNCVALVDIELSNSFVSSVRLGLGQNGSQRGRAPLSTLDSSLCLSLTIRATVLQ